MEIKVLKTFELSTNDWEQIVAGFNNSFHRPTSYICLKSFYEENVFGYAYHALGFEGEKLIGFNSITPHYYLHNGEKIILGLSGTVFVLKEYRKDIFIFADLYNALKEYCFNENMIAFLGVPNANAYKYSIQFLKCKEVSKLSYYIFPVKIFNIIGKHSLSRLNCISCFFAYIWLIINVVLSMIWNSKERFTHYKLDINDDFYTKRFSASRYKTIKNKNTTFTYTIADEDGILTAYIMDFRCNNRKRYRALIRTVRHILRHEKVDLIMYVGTMNLKQYLLIRVPKNLKPRDLPFTYNILKKDTDHLYADMDNLKNWDFSLMNLDVR